MPVTPYQAKRTRLVILLPSTQKTIVPGRIPMAVAQK